MDRVKVLLFLLYVVLAVVTWLVMFVVGLALYRFGQSLIT